MCNFEEKKIVLNWQNINQFTRNHREYLFVDYAEVIPGKKAIGKKMVSGLDWYFRIHLPDDPVMPGVFVMESIMTTGAFTLYTQDDFYESKFIFHSADSVRLYRDVRPGDELICDTSLLSYSRGVAKFEGKALVSDYSVCKMKFTLIEPNIIKGVMNS